MNIRKIRDEMSRGSSINELPLRVTFYARVSTDKLEQQGSLENQIQYYTDYIQKNPNWIYVPGYIDEGISGTSTYKRESFLRMITDAKRERFDFIITKEISRFSRNTLDSIKYTQELLDTGVGVLFQNDNINTLDSDSEFRLVVMAGVAQDEVRKLSERLKFGFRQSIKNGHVLGNDQLWGYDKKDCKLSIIPEQAEAVKLIFELYATGDYGLRKLSLVLTERGYTSKLGNDFNPVTIGHILTNPKYKGWYCGNKTKSLSYRKKNTEYLPEDQWVMYPDPQIPAIVTEELWNRANAIYKKRSQRAKCHGVGYQSRYAYSGKIICEKHGTSFHRQTFKTRTGITEFWKCKVYRQKGKNECTSPSIRTNELNAVLADIFGRVVTNKAQIINLVLNSLKDSDRQVDNKVPIQRIQEQIGQLEIKKDKLLELSMEDAITMQEFKQRNNRFNDQIVELQRQRIDLEQQEEASKNATQDMCAIKKVLEEELNFEKTISTDVVGAILDHVVVGEKSTESEIHLEVFLRVGWNEFVILNRDPFVFSISSSRSIIPKQGIKMI